MQSNPAQASPATQAPAPRPRLTHAAVNYRPRAIAYLLFALMLLSIFGTQLPAAHAALLFFFLAWPHFAYWRARRKGGGRNAENFNVLVDCVMGGVIMLAWAFRPWPTVAMYFAGSHNVFLYGGPRYALLGVLLSLVGLLAAWPIFGWAFHFESEPGAVALSIFTILCYSALMGTTAYRLRRRQRETRVALEAEQNKSQELLLNVFPVSVVPRLRAGEAPIADQFADVTVVFADIVDFTPLAERLGPKRTVLLLNDLFARFDQAAARLGVEKIETTGDGYLAVGGAPQPLDDHPEAVAVLGLAMVEAARQVRISDTEHVRIRVGIHTGPILAGVIGESRFHYKIFGETVNVASRVQSQSQPERVLVSETTFKRIRDVFLLDEHGTIELKGHGPMRTFWLRAPRRTEGHALAAGCPSQRETV